MAHLSYEDDEYLEEAYSPHYERVSLQEDSGALPVCKRKNKKAETLIDELDDIIVETGGRKSVTGTLTLADRTQLLLDDTRYQAFMASCIMVNAAVIGGETDFPQLELWHVIESAFLIIFSSELLMRMYAVGLKGFFSPGEDQMWNLLDFAIVGLGVFDFICEKVGAQPEHHPDAHSKQEEQEQGGGVSTLFRMIRLLRILRVFKIVRFLKQLYMIFFGFVEAIQAICLVAVLMFFVLYLCSVVMVRMYGRVALAAPDDKAIILITNFKSIKTSMLSLFELMSNPGNLSNYHDLMDEYPMLTLFLIAFVIFGSFGMIALLTGVISESMFDKNQTRVHELRQEREQKRELLKQKCIELFGFVDKNEVGEASHSDLEDLLPYIRDMFEKLEIEYMEHDFDNIINMCDTNDSGSISETEFVGGILSLCDGLRAASIQEVHYLVSQMSSKVMKMQIDVLHEEVKTIRNLTEGALPELQGGMQKIMQKLETQSPARPSSNAARPSSNGFSSVVATQLTESHLSDMRASIDFAMDANAEAISKKIDDLQVNLKELCKRQDLVNANVFTVPEAQTTNTCWADFECKNKTILPDLWSGNLESKAMGTGKPGQPSCVSTSDADRSGAVLSPLPAAGTAQGQPAHVSSVFNRAYNDW